MAHTIDELVAAIKQIRDYAAGYDGRKRKDFYTNLYAMLATPIPQDANYSVNIKNMYIAAVGALTSEIQPPTAETYIEVVSKLNHALEEQILDPINIVVYPDEGMKNAYQIVGEMQAQDLSKPRTEQLQNALPRKRKLTKKSQALVDKFREEIPSTNRLFRNSNGGQQRG